MCLFENGCKSTQKNTTLKFVFSEKKNGLTLSQPEKCGVIIRELNP